MKIKEVMNDLKRIKTSIENILQKTTDECGELDGNIQYEHDPEDEMMRYEIRIMLEKLDYVKNTLEYLNEPICCEGYLSKNSNGRYEIDGFEFNCGNSVEILFYDEYDEKETWSRSRIEHNGKDYYIAGYGNVKLDGLKVRIR